MSITGIADEHYFLCDLMTRLIDGTAWVDSMPVVQAATDRVTLHDLDAHCSPAGVRAVVCKLSDEVW